MIKTLIAWEQTIVLEQKFSALIHHQRAWNERGDRMKSNVESEERAICHEKYNKRGLPEWFSVSTVFCVEKKG